MNPRNRWKLKRLFIPRSLLYQLLTRSLYILAALLVLIGFLQYWLMKDFLYRSQAEAMDAQLMAMPKGWFGRTVPERFDMNGTMENQHELAVTRAERHFLFMPDKSLAYIDPNGTFKDIFRENGIGSPQLSTEEYRELLSEQYNMPYKRSDYRLLKDEQGNEQLVIFRPVGPPDHPQGLLQMGSMAAPLTALLMRQLLLFICLSVFALGGGLVLNVSVLRKTLHPLTRIVHVVEQIDAGKLDERFPVNQGQKEIDRLSDSFNGMLERLKVSFEAEREAKEQMRQFIADASHELRTPLTSIRGFLEVLLRGAASNPEQLYSALNSMEGESRRINKLVEDLLLLVKFDRAPQLSKHVTRLDTLLREMEPQLRLLASEREVRLMLGENVSTLCDADKIKQVILNLFHNAVQHTAPKEGVIGILLTIVGPVIELSVRDNGTGIDEAQLTRVFERFYRSDVSRTRKYGGAGLGLSISQSIIEAHGGSIEVDSQKGVGSVFKVILPTDGIAINKHI